MLYNVIGLKVLKETKMKQETIQKHITIERDFCELIESKMKSDGQKLSPLCNSLLKKYFKNRMEVQINS